MIKLLRNLKIDTSGASAAEYALIVAILGALVVLGATVFGNSLSSSLGRSASTLDGAGVTP